MEPRYNDWYMPPGKKKDDGLKGELEEVKARLPDKTQRAVDLACEKGASNWLTVIPLEDNMVCYDLQVEPALQLITGKELGRGANQAPDACLDVHCEGFWERQRAAFLI